MSGPEDPLDFLRSEMTKAVALFPFLAMNRAADEIERLRTGIEDALDWTDSGGECGQRLYNLLHPEPGTSAIPEDPS